MAGKDYNLAKKTVQDEILDKLNEGVSINGTAQTKKYTQSIYGKMPASDVTITGSGRAVFWAMSTNVGYLTLTVDGVAVLPSDTVAFRTDMFDGPLEVYFEKSIVFKANNTDRIHYMVQT